MVVKILVVDDEPRVSIGIKNFLLDSELGVTYVETALNGFEAIDYLRMDAFDLVLTDIQMSRMNGIELMETIYLEQPHLPVVVISAHEKFDFAKKSLRLGARDYLVKPVERDDLLRVVRRVLGEKREIGERSLALSRLQSEKGEARPRSSARNELLLGLVTDSSLSKPQYDAMIAELGDAVKGGYFGVMSVRLDLSRGGFSERDVSLQDRKLLKYASLNIMEESLSDWNGLVINGFGNTLIGIVQLSEHEADGQRMHARSQVHLLGQMIHMNLKQYLNVDTTVGMSSLYEDVFMLPQLMEEANTAAEWKHLHPGRRVFYYEDVKATERLNLHTAFEQDQSILSRITGYVKQHYRNPALKIQDIAGEVHFSPAYLGYLFKREMKKNLWDYVTELRIEEAKRLLVTTDKKRYEVAYAVGYESPEHFGRMFKRYAGVSPAEYRKEGQGGAG